MSASTRHFIRHFVEMVIAMFLGMVVLGVPGEGALHLIGSSTMELSETAPAVVFIGMGITMTLPMVRWMRYRGHGWQPCAEMAAAMFVPTFAALGLMATGLMTDFGTLMRIEHTAMLPAMLIAMLLRREEYSGGHRHHGDLRAEAAA